MQNHDHKDTRPTLATAVAAPQQPAHPTIAIPSFREVQAAERSRVPHRPLPPTDLRGPPPRVQQALSGPQAPMLRPLAFVEGFSTRPAAPTPPPQAQTTAYRQRPPLPPSGALQANSQPSASQPTTYHTQQPPAHHHHHHLHQHQPAYRPPWPHPTPPLPTQHAAHARPMAASDASAGTPSASGGAPSARQETFHVLQRQQGALLGPPQPPQQYVTPLPNLPPTPPAINPNVVTVSRRQQGNPVLKHIRNVRWQFGDIVPDYIIGQTTAALFLSLRYHLLKPEYIFVRMKELGRAAYRLRVLLVHVDTEDAVEPLAAVTRAAIGNEFTLFCGFTTAECGRYLEILKSYERKPAETIQKDLGTDYVSRATSALTVVRGVNRTDVKTLGDAFGSIAAVLSATETELRACPGIGPTKAKRLYDAFHEPFKKTLSLTQQQQQRLRSPGSEGQVPAAASPPAAQNAPAAVPTAVNVGDENDDGDGEDDPWDMS